MRTAPRCKPVSLCRRGSVFQNLRQETGKPSLDVIEAQNIDVLDAALGRHDQPAFTQGAEMAAEGRFRHLTEGRGSRRAVQPSPCLMEFLNDLETHRIGKRRENMMKLQGFDGGMNERDHTRGIARSLSKLNCSVLLNYRIIGAGS